MRRDTIYKTDKTRTIILKLGQSWDWDNFNDVIIWTHRSQVSFLTGSNKHSCCKFFHVSFLLPSSVFLAFLLFLYFLFTSVSLHAISHLALVDCFSTLCRPGCMQRTLSHVISPTCELAFLLHCSLIGRLWSSFLSTIFLMSYNLHIFLVSDTNPFSFLSLCDFTVLMITFPKLLCSSYVLFHETCNLYFAKLTFYLPTEGISHMMSAVFASCWFGSFFLLLCVCLLISEWNWRWGGERGGGGEDCCVCANQATTSSAEALFVLSFVLCIRKT